MPRPPLRRSRLKARIAAAHGTLRVLEQALRAASSALALWEEAIWRRARHTLVGTRQGIFTRVLPRELALCRLTVHGPRPQSV